VVVVVVVQWQCFNVAIFHHIIFGACPVVSSWMIRCFWFIFTTLPSLTFTCQIAHVHTGMPFVCNKLLNVVNLHVIDWCVWPSGWLLIVPWLPLNAVYHPYACVLTVLHPWTVSSMSAYFEPSSTKCLIKHYNSLLANPAVWWSIRMQIGVMCGGWHMK
jgi:hypothetical protein